MAEQSDSSQGELVGREPFAILSPAQADVLAHGLLDTGFNCVLQMPTGSGKTWLAEHAIESALSNGDRALYLAPLRALASEIAGRWQKRFSPARVGLFTGDYGRTGKAYPIPFREAQVLVMTPERLDACTRHWRAHWSWIPGVSVCIVDELHLLGDRHRGARLEGALSRLRRLNPFLWLLGLSATLGNRQELAHWLDGVEYASTWRPVPLVWTIRRYRNAREKPDMLVQEATATLVSGGKSLVFVQSRSRAEELSRYLQDCGVRSHYHHAGLSHERRQTIEGGFRSGDIDVLVATSALEMGLNLPARKVILYDMQRFDGIFFEPLSTNTVWQRAGRAGRPGLDGQGEVVLFAARWDSQVKAYERGAFEPIRSGLSDKRALAEQVIAEVASGLARTPAQLLRVFGQSLASMQGTLPDVKATIADMCQAGLLRETTAEERDTSLRGAVLLTATRLGHVASRHLLSPGTVMLFQKVLEAEPTSTFFDLLLLAACSDECEPLLYVDFEELEHLSSLLAREPTSLLHRPASHILRALGVGGKRLLSAIKMALVIRAAWMRCGDADEAADEFGCYPFEVVRLAASIGRLLSALAEIVEPGEDAPDSVGLSEGTRSLSQRLQALQQMVMAGLGEEAATLTLINGIGAKIAKRLHTAGICDIEDLAQACVADVCQLGGIRETRAQRWIDQAQASIKERSALYYREMEPPLKLAPMEMPTGIDPYRLRRALDLHIAEIDSSQYAVTGGLEPHIVQVKDGRLSCDCPDASKGYQCKHMLGVRLCRGEQKLSEFSQELRSPSHDQLDLFQLWLDDRPALGKEGSSAQVV